MQEDLFLLFDGWRMAAVAIGWLRANRAHPLRFSILALLPTVRRMAWWVEASDSCELSAADAAAAVKARELNADRFIDSRFCRAQLAAPHDRVAAAAAAAATTAPCRATNTRS